MLQAGTQGCRAWSSPCKLLAFRSEFDITKKGMKNVRDLLGEYICLTIQPLSANLTLPFLPPKRLDPGPVPERRESCVFAHDRH